MDWILNSHMMIFFLFRETTEEDSWKQHKMSTVSWKIHRWEGEAPLCSRLHRSEMSIASMVWWRNVLIQLEMIHLLGTSLMLWPRRFTMWCIALYPVRGCGESMWYDGLMRWFSTFFISRTTSYRISLLSSRNLLSPYFYFFVFFRELITRSYHMIIPQKQQK